MAPQAERTPQRQTSTTSSRSASDDQSPSRYSNPDIFSDSFALEPLGVADGFRPPSHDRTPSAETTSTLRSNSRRSIGFQHNREPTSIIPRRSAGSQRLGRNNSYPLRYDAATLQKPRRTPSAASVSDMSDGPSGNRPLSTVSSISMQRAQSPYQGTMGPSHPYGMYPQNIAMARTPSIATSSSIRAPEPSYAGSNVPMHPYGMYPQNTVHEGEVSPIAGTAPIIPVGFPGLGQQYRRQLGPEGEDADDIIGPDGHTEQLPPYTRYPDSLPPKPRRAESAVIDESNPFRSPVQPIHTHSSMGGSYSSDEDVPQVNANVPQMNIVPAATTGSSDGISSAKEKWAAKGRRRTCGGKLPVWAIIVVVMILLVIVGGLLGGIIGRLSAGRHAKQKAQLPLDVDPDPAMQTGTVPAASTVFETITATLVDATPLASIPPNLPPLPTGSFGIPLTKPTKAYNACLGNSSWNNAWSCSSSEYLGLNVIQDYGPSRVSLSSAVPGSPELPIKYGAQPPQLSSLCNLMLVTVKEDTTRGPAYFFQQLFNKTVVVGEYEYPFVNFKRWLDDPIEDEVIEERHDHRARFALPGHKPWFCFWNDTVLEGFIYVTQTSSAESQNTTALEYDSAASSSTSPALAIASIVDLIDTSDDSTPSDERRELFQPIDLPNPYPKVIKLEERRNARNMIQPYCQQMQILDDRRVVPVLDALGNAVTVPLNTTETSVQQSEGYSGRRERDGMRYWSRRHSVKERKREVASDACYCEWMSE